ncbi:hypothetical protein [Legionella bozemanae]|uniref:Uncharacterized protein n=1 Tax=Legionella bozemanae TaxID=447 RepID=A0A0W0R9R5_LEGBO|nr:hypothetical protein [Legionella bozemanae]KTC67823.1 hypothetical protein Lboz_3466 [Legionella bozemanae]STP14024.1 Uncharacterised protein [Legionella bozemanae]
MMWYKKNLKEYATKLDGYYFDKNLKQTILVLKIRNKRTIFHISIKEIFTYKEYLSTLHPIDLCIIGILANEKNIESTAKDYKFITVPDSYLMVRIQPFLEIQGRQFQGSSEIIKLKVKNIDKKISVSAKELFNNKKLISALQYQDALSLGFSLSASETDTSQIIMRKRATYSYFQTIQNSIFLTFFFLSILLVGQSFLVQEINFHGEILFLPFLILLFSHINDNLFLWESNKILMIVIIIVIAFMLYFSWIIELPFPYDDHKVDAFRMLHHIIMNNSIKFIFPFVLSSIADTFIKRIPKKISFYSQNRLFSINMYTCLFFISAFCISHILNISSYSIVDFIYTIISLFVLSSFKNLSKR